MVSVNGVGAIAARPVAMNVAGAETKGAAMYSSARIAKRHDGDDTIGLERVSNRQDAETETRMTTEEMAPGRLGLVHALMATAYGHGKREEFRAPEDVRAWLRARALLPAHAPVTEGEFRQVIAFREALRALLAANNGGPIDPEAIERLNALATQAPMRVRILPDGDAALQPVADGVAGALGELLSVVVMAMHDGSWARLKACHNDRCALVYYDTSNNRSRRWCAMAGCGRRAKVRAYRARLRHEKARPG